MFLFWGIFPFFHWNWFGELIGLLVSVAIICAVVRIILRTVRGESSHHHHHHGDWTEKDSASSEARRILDERYAKGEITEEEYKRMRENLK